MRFQIGKHGLSISKHGIVIGKSADLSFASSRGWGMDNTVPQLVDQHAQIRAARGTVAACISYLANGTAMIPSRLYYKRGRKAKALKYTQTRPVSKKFKDYVFTRADLVNHVKGAVDLEEIVESPVLELLSGVNGHMNQFDLVQLTQKFQSATGNAYWYLPKNGAGVPSEVWVLHSQYMKVIPDKEKFVKGYVYRRGVEKIEYDVDEIIHFRTWGLNSYHYGESPIADAADMIGLRKMMTDYDYHVIKNDGRVSVALETDVTMDNKRAEQLQARWVTGHTGMNRNKPAILSDGLKLNQFGMSQADMGFETGYKMTKLEIANQFGVPISMLETDNVNMANAKTGMTHFATYGLYPLIIQRDQKWIEKLLPMFPRAENQIFISDNPVPEDKELLTEMHTKLVTAGIEARDEARAVFSLEARGGDADMLYVPMNLIPIGENVEAVTEAIAVELAKQIRSKSS